MKRTNNSAAKMLFVLLLGMTVMATMAIAEGTGWIHPKMFVGGTYDDNVFLERDDVDTDFIVTTKLGAVIEPELARHNLIVDYEAELNFFTNFLDQNNYNHDLLSAFKYNANKWSILVDNKFRYFSDRSGEDDTNRVDRIYDVVRVKGTYDFTKMKVSSGYTFRVDDYSSDAGIGRFEGKALTYKDLNRNEHTGDVEAAIQMWQKTYFLLAGDIGGITHDTGNKSDSLYFDLFGGVRGEPTAKSTFETKIGYRYQDYEDYGPDFKNIVFNGSWLINFTTLDSFRADFLRTTNDTVFRDNAYYTITFGGLEYEHGFTKRFFATVLGSYQNDGYPTIPAGSGEKRSDNIWIGGIKLTYETPLEIVAQLKYEYRTKDSNYSGFNYEDNTIGLSLSKKF